MEYELHQHSHLPEFVLRDETGKIRGRSKIFITPKNNFCFHKLFQGIEGGHNSPSKFAYDSLEAAMQAAHDFLVFEYYENFGSFGCIRHVLKDKTDYAKPNQLKEAAQKFRDHYQKIQKHGLVATGSIF